jgi:hypothetical protein
MAEVGGDIIRRECRVSSVCTYVEKKVRGNLSGVGEQDLGVEYKVQFKLPVLVQVVSRSRQALIR